MASLRINRVLAPAATRLHISGDLDLDCADALRSVLLEAVDGSAGAAVLVDLSGVSFLDCSGLEALLAGVRHAEQRRTRLVLVSPSRPVRRILQLTGLAGTLLVPAPRAAGTDH